MAGLRVGNWGMLLLAVYLILIGIQTLGISLLGLGRIDGIVALIAGILILMEHTRGR